MDDARLKLLLPISLGAPVVERARLAARLRLEIEPHGPVEVHVALRGRSSLESADGAASFTAGDLLLVRGARVTKVDARGGPANDTTMGVETVRARYGADRFLHPPSTHGPRAFHLRAAELQRDARLADVAQLAALIARSAGAGADVEQGTLSARLFDALFVALERRRLADDARTSPIALTDARIARIVAQLHERPADRWTVAKLAKAAGMSRAAFARRFLELTGTAPHGYLANLRIELARELLVSTRDSLSEIARRVGYQSEHAFSRAFKRRIGVPPAVHRRTERATMRAAA